MAVAVVILAVLDAALIGAAVHILRPNPSAGYEPESRGIANNLTESEGPESENVETETTETEAEPQWDPDPVRVKGIYVTGPMAGNSNLDSLIELVDSTELNTMVIDVKNDGGEITYHMSSVDGEEYSASVGYITDIQALMEKLKEHNIYTIARIVCFKDPCLAEEHPELALKKPDGTPITDGNGLAWVNPYKEEVWEYLTDIALAAAADGFDEVQFDYVRFPIGSDADAADYGVDQSAYPKYQAISDFLSYAAERLHGQQVLFGADLFGTVIGSEEDVENVGQDYPVIGGIVDALCPMIYPSHYGNGVYGLDVPDAHPYELILHALTDSKEELSLLEESERAAVRPWLQAFTATWVSGHISYGGTQIRQQIQAVYDAGYEEWILWNASNRYSADGLEPADTAE